MANEILDPIRAPRDPEPIPDVILSRTLKTRRREFSLRKPMRIEVEKRGDLFTVANAELHLSGSGETEKEALDEMKEIFDGVWAILIDTDHKSPNFEARKMRAKLLEFVEKPA